MPQPRGPSHPGHRLTGISSRQAYSTPRRSGRDVALDATIHASALLGKPTRTEDIKERPHIPRGCHPERKYPVVKGHKYPVVKGHKYPVVKGHKYPELQGYKRRVPTAQNRDSSPSLRYSSPVPGPLWIWLTPDWWAATCTAPSTERKRAQRTSISRGDSSQILVGGQRPVMPGRIAPAGWAYTPGEWDRLGGSTTRFGSLPMTEMWHPSEFSTKFPQRCAKCG
jgi:hypothetical protein